MFPQIWCLCYQEEYPFYEMKNLEEHFHAQILIQFFTCDLEHMDIEMCQMVFRVKLKI